MIRQAVILAGGIGSRLLPAVSDVPKPMAPVAGRPFLAYVLDQLWEAGIKEIVLSVGYKSEVIRQHFKDQYNGVKLIYAVEVEALGTGGAIKYAATFLREEPFFLINGDTLFQVDLHQLEAFHNQTNADISIALKEMTRPDRYGTVQTDGERITAFREKIPGLDKGWVNAGVYVLSGKVIREVKEKVFSFEERVLEQGVDRLSIMGWKTEAYFVDIGIPEDYQKANEDLRKIGN